MSSSSVDFPIVHDEERRIRADHTRRIGELEAARGLCEHIAALAGDARFKLWVAQLEELQRRAEHELRTAVETNAVFRAQGKVQALSSVVAITRAAEAERKALAERLLEEHDRASKAGLDGAGAIHPSGGIWSDHGRHEQQQQGRRDAGDGNGA